MIGWWLMVPLGAEQPQAPCTSLQIGILSLQASSAEREYCLASWKLTSRQLTTQNQEPSNQLFKVASWVLRRRAQSREREYCLTGHRTAATQQPTIDKLSHTNHGDQNSQNRRVGILSFEASSAVAREKMVWPIDILKATNSPILTSWLARHHPHHDVCVPQPLALTTAKEFNYSGNFYDSKHWDRVEFEGISTKIAKILQRPSEKNW